MALSLQPMARAIHEIDGDIPCGMPCQIPMICSLPSAFSLPREGSPLVSNKTEEAIAPLLRSMRATGRTTYVTDPERGVIWGHAFLRPPYAPSADVEWFVGWGLRFPDGGSGWGDADPRLPSVPHAIVAVGVSGAQCGPSSRVPPALLPQGWSTVGGEAAFVGGIAPADRPAGSAGRLGGGAGCLDP